MAVDMAVGVAVAIDVAMVLAVVLAAAVAVAVGFVATIRTHKEFVWSSVCKNFYNKCIKKEQVSYCSLIIMFH